LLSSSLLKRISDNHQGLIKKIPVIDEQLELERNLYEGSLYEFLRGAWGTVEGNRQFVDGWHLGALCEHLEAVYYGQIKNLLVNIPPGCCKSTIFATIFTPWCWTKDESLRFLYVSYGQSVAQKDSVKARRIIDSAWYQRLWGHKYQLTGDVNTKSRFDNNRGGYRITSSVGGSATGEGGDVIIIDDANNAGESESDIVRDSTNEWCDFVLSTRLRNPKTGRMVGIQQRLHHQDYSGNTLSKNMDDLVHLCLPMEFEKSRKCYTIPLPSTNNKPWCDPRKKEGELLWPDFIGEPELIKIKKKLKNNQYVISGQLQQLPTPSAGGLFKRSWFRIWKEASPPDCWFILQSWDTAFGGENESKDKSETAYSACTTWGVFKYQDINHVILLDMWKGKVEYPELRQMAQRLSMNYHDTDLLKPWSGRFEPHVILVEAKANGLSLIQDLRRAGVLATPFNPTRHGSKEDRARRITPYFECGRVWLGGQPPHYTEFRPYAEEFIQAAIQFPKNNLSKDIVDSTSQAFARLTSSGYIQHRDDEIEIPDYNQLMRKAELIHGKQ